MLDLNKSTNFNKKSNFKTFVNVLYDMYNFTIRYNLYDTHTVSYDSWTFMIRWYNTELLHTIRYVSYDRVSYDTDNYAWSR